MKKIRILDVLEDELGELDWEYVKGHRPTVDLEIEISNFGGDARLNLLWVNCFTFT